MRDERNSIDQMIDLARVFSREITLGRDLDRNYVVDIESVWTKEHPESAIIKGISGRGHTVAEACADFMANAKGKLLVARDEAFYGKRGPEVICV